MRYLVIILSLLCFSAYSQEVKLSGTIIDAKTKEAIPFANVYFTGTTIGTSSGLDGEFSLSTKTAVTSLTVSIIGYTAKEIKIKDRKKSNLVIKLTPESIDIAEVEIKAKRGRRKKDTTAIRIFRNVVANKEVNRMKSFDYYEYDAYTKTQFDLFNIQEDKVRHNKLLSGMDVAFDYIDTTEGGNTFLPVLLRERSSKIYYSRDPKARKEVVKAEQFSGIGNASVAALINEQFESVDVYSNLLVVSGKSFITPFADGALAVYHYTLADSALIEGRSCYQLYFIGKSLQDLVFKGFAWIDKETWAIKEIELKIGTKTNINWLNDYYVFQSFIQLDEQKGWFIDKEIANQAISLFKTKDKLTFKVTQTVSREDVRINFERDHKFYHGDPTEYENFARDRDENFWKDVRHDSLTINEQGIYVMVDSVTNTRKLKQLKWLAYLASTAYMKTGPIEWGRIYQVYSWNEVEGKRYRIGVRTNSNLSERFQFSSHIAYSTKDEDIKFGVKGFTHLTRKNYKWHSLEASYLDDYTRLGNDENPLLRYDNIFNSLLRTGQLDDLMRIRDIRATYKREFRQGVLGSFTVGRRSFGTVPGRFEFIPNDANGADVDTNEITAVGFVVSMRLTSKEKVFEDHYKRYSLGSKMPILILTYSNGIKGILGGDYNFHKLAVHLTYRNSVPFGYTNYQFFAGHIFGEIPYPLLEFHAGNETYLHSKFKYNLMNEFEFASDSYMALGLDHHFDGFIMNKIPGVRKLQLRLLIVSKVLFGHIQDINKDENAIIKFPRDENGIVLLNSPQPVYAEVGFGVENILKVGRIDFVWRLTHKDNPDIKTWWFKLAFVPKF